jgi:hypothetical protein
MGARTVTLYHVTNRSRQDLLEATLAHVGSKWLQYRHDLISAALHNAITGDAFEAHASPCMLSSTVIAKLLRCGGQMIAQPSLPLRKAKLQFRLLEIPEHPQSNDQQWH